MTLPKLDIPPLGESYKRWLQWLLGIVVTVLVAAVGFGLTVLRSHDQAITEMAARWAERDRQRVEDQRWRERIEDKIDRLLQRGQP